MRPHPLAVALLAAATVGCATRPRITLPDRPALPPGATPLFYGGAGVAGFYRPDGQPCRRPDREPRRGLVGWQTGRGEDFACLRDSLDHGLATSSLELRFRAVIPADGDYDLLARELTLDAGTRVLVRGAPYGEYTARAWFELQARTPSCTVTWVQELATAVVTAPMERSAGSRGWVILPDLVLEGCHAGEVLEARLRLLGEVNRGQVIVESYGLVVSSADELSDALALRRRAERTAAP
jgi:hypothetical protein